MDADRVIVGISGGVDSAVAAALLVRERRQVHALFMRNWDAEDDAYCTAAADLQDARRVCEDLGIPLHVVNFAAEYRARVFRHFLDELAAGRTPNPDVLCNREIKFGVCLEHARRLGAVRFATGHYARIDLAGGRARLKRGADRAKDQSYFLHAVPEEALRRCEFPLGDLSKSEVRRLAREFALPVHDKRDSTGICFIGERPFGAFLSQYLAARPGPIETAAGERLGTHRGLMYYTLGQRQGLALGGVRGAAEAPWYVAAKDLDRNRLVVVQDAAHPLLTSHEFRTERAHWIADSPPASRFRCSVKLRYRQADQACEVTVLDGRCDVRLSLPQRAVTPGQSAVFYDGEICLGGAVIDAVRGSVEAGIRSA
jgi:tRNA-specific 2-thiouridylase